MPLSKQLQISLDLLMHVKLHAIMDPYNAFPWNRSDMLLLHSSTAWPDPAFPIHKASCYYYLQTATLLLKGPHGRYGWHA